MITILAVTDGFKHFGEAIDEYGKRLGKTIHLKPLKPISHTNPEYIKIKETTLIKESLKKLSGTIILLDERGKGMSTRDFTDMLEDGRNQSEDFIFIIGGSYGVDLELFADVPHKTLRISDFVMPHSLALLVLIEQIYRAHEIMKGSGYHHS
jgi:23S rRNA (pseudouridine1915-N3)-methyltransferase